MISTYNGDGLRVGKSVNDTLTRYLYEYQRVVLEVNVLGDQTGRNVYGINLLTRQVGVDTFIYMYNGHADVTALLNTAGTVVATYYYDAFGNILDQTGVLSNNILYAGYQYDSETGLYYLNARMYDPVTARFMQEDSFTGDRNDPLSLNLYTYCHNEPLMYSDPTGHKEYRPGEATADYYRGVGSVGMYERPAWAYKSEPRWNWDKWDAHVQDIGSVDLLAIMSDKDTLNSIALRCRPDVILKAKEAGEKLTGEQIDFRAQGMAISEVLMSGWIDPETVEPSFLGYLDYGVTKAFDDQYAKLKKDVNKNVDNYWNSMEKEYNLSDNVLFQIAKYQGKWNIALLEGASNFAFGTVTGPLNIIQGATYDSYQFGYTFEAKKDGYYDQVDQYIESLETVRKDPLKAASNFYGSIGNAVVETVKDPYKCGTVCGELMMTAITFGVGSVSAAGKASVVDDALGLTDDALGLTDDALGLTDDALGLTDDAAKTVPQQLTREGNTPVIGTMTDLNAPGSVFKGEFKVADYLPNMGSPKLNWKQNDGILRSIMNERVPILDISLFPKGNAPFLSAERNLFQSRGWTYLDGYWYPPV